MNRFAPGTFSGNYTPQGDISKADCIIGHEFAYRKTGYGNVNELLAQFIANHLLELKLPLFINDNIAGALRHIAPEVKPEKIFSGESTKISTSGQGTWGELSQARDAMIDDKLNRKLNRPILVAQAYHVGRAALQAEAMDMEPVVLQGLPREFDPESKQIWTKGPVRWGLSQLVAVPLLRHRAQL